MCLIETTATGKKKNNNHPPRMEEVMWPKEMVKIYDKLIEPSLLLSEW